MGIIFEQFEQVSTALDLIDAFFPGDYFMSDEHMDEWRATLDATAEEVGLGVDMWERIIEVRCEIVWMFEEIVGAENLAPVPLQNMRPLWASQLLLSEVK